MQKIKFAIISPLGGLERYSTLSRIHLVLAPLLKNKTYLEFYCRMRDRGDEIILDNGAYEEGHPLGEDSYWQAILDLQPTVAALPDYLLQDPRKTVSASLRFLDKYVGRTTCQWMFVPQAEKGDRRGIGWAVDTVLMDPRVGQYVGWIGLPRVLASHFENWRPEIAGAIRSTYPHIKLHALGMANGDVGEMKACEYAGVYSIDSSAPVYRGGFGLSITDEDDRKMWDERGEAFNLTKEGEFEGQHGKIMQNLKEVGVG